jgi:formylglycine-generating enzyme required for sulfatase activity
MRRWFLSFHSPDQLLAERLKVALERKDPDAQVYFAPSSLRAGGFWSRALADAISQADAFILLVGESGVGNWQVVEYDEALDKRVKSPDFPVILVLLEGQTAPGLPFLRRLHWIITADPSSEKDLARLLGAASGRSTRPGELWRYTSPYRGLAAMEEKDSDYFFGRERETIEALSALAATADRLSLMLGNSGVGKSSLARAGVLAALKRQAWPESAHTALDWPVAFQESRLWCFLTLKPGTEPLKALVESFIDTWQLAAADPERVKLQNGWIKLLRNGEAGLRDLLDATERRYKELDRNNPPAFLLYIDQGEELYVRAEELQRRCFSEVIAQTITDPRLFMLMSMRTDFFGELQKDEPLFKVHRQINVPPLHEAKLREVVSRPAELLSARFETPGLVDVITRRAAEDSVKDVGALPLLSYTLEDMWKHMIQQGDGVLRLSAQSFELGGALVNRADAFVAAHPNEADQLRRILTLKLATVRDGEEPTRRRALRSEFTDEEWRLVHELADHPYRLLVTATLEAGEIWAEVTHETLFRRWGKLRDWIAAEREFLAWKAGLEAACRAWKNTSDNTKNDALLMGASLTHAQNWQAKRGTDLPGIGREFIDQSTKRDNKLRDRARHMRAFVYVLLVGIITGLVGWINQGYLKEQWSWYTIMRPYMVAEVRPYVLSSDAEAALKPRDTFRECAKDCPEMILVRAGNFITGSDMNEDGRFEDEGPQHVVAIEPFAASKFAVTFGDWDACVAAGGCPQVGDSGFGREKRPVINVTWYQAHRYAEWFSKMTGRPYRLLTEAEWEYAARADSETAYCWGPEIGKGNANCRDCGSEWDAKRTATVGAFAPNMFGFFDMAGNVWQWVQDCYNDAYYNAPTDGSAWVAGDCTLRVVRGGSWESDPDFLRSATRLRYHADYSAKSIGFRLGRTIRALPNSSNPGVYDGDKALVGGTSVAGLE